MNKEDKNSNTNLSITINGVVKIPVIEIISDNECILKYIDIT